MLKMYKKLWSKIKKQTECSKCNVAESVKNETDPMKIRFDSYGDDDLPLDKIL